MDATITTPGTLQLTPELSDNIRALSFDGLKALPRRGAEIGGLITASPSTPAIADDLILVKCEYLFGPSWHLSSTDIPKLQNAAQQCSADGKIVAAFFRSCTRPAVELDAEDRLAIAECCAEVPFAVIARPALNGSARISVFRRAQEGAWDSIEEFTVPAPRKSAPERREPNIPVPERSAADDTPAVAAREFPEPPQRFARIPEPIPALLPSTSNRQLPAQIRQASPLPEWRPYLWYLVPVLLLGMGVAGYEMRPRTAKAVPAAEAAPKPAPRDTSREANLGLSVRDEGGKLHLTWDRGSETAKSATGGVLEIDDASSPTTIALRPSDVADGSLIYTPRSSDITFRLRILNSSGRYVSEMLRVVGGEQRGRVEQARQSPAPVTSAPNRTLAGNTPERSRPQQPLQQQPPPRQYPWFLSSLLSPKAYQPLQRSPLGASTEPPAGPAGSAAAPSPNLQAADHGPSPASETAPPQSNVAERISQAPRSEPVNSQPAVTQTPALLNDSGAKRAPAVTEPVHAPAPAITQPPPAGNRPAPAASIATPPEPVRRVTPTGISARWNVPGTVKIPILVSVDAKGVVTSASAVKDGQHPSLFLVGSCLNAAREWTFKPAKLNGKPVASQYRIEFVFSDNK